jgi:hypothetical protein
LTLPFWPVSNYKPLIDLDSIKLDRIGDRHSLRPPRLQVSKVTFISASAIQNDQRHAVRGPMHLTFFFKISSFQIAGQISKTKLVIAAIPGYI